MNFRPFGDSVYMFSSRIDRERLFSTHDAARRYDRALATRIVGAATAADFEAAFKIRNDQLAKALMFLAEETDLFEAEWAESC